MHVCETCGNSYDKVIKVKVADGMHIFDSFECAIHALAPKCGHCECRVIGHGVDMDGKIYCCEHCARQAGGHSRMTRPGRKRRSTGRATTLAARKH